MPEAPVLLGEPTCDYLYAQSGTYVVDVEWQNDALASAWGVYRSEATPIGEIVDAADLGAGKYRVVFKGHAAALLPGDDAFTSRSYLGTIDKVDL